MKLRYRIILGLAALCLSACQPMVNSSNHLADASSRAYRDTSHKWYDLFSYRSRPSEQLPQTRYCYGTQSDIVCYDSPQSGITSKIVGYQDGDNFSGFQPGGGSLGVSGSEPTATYQTSEVQAAPPQEVNLSAAPVVESAPIAAVSAAPVAAPFETGASSYAKNAAIADRIAQEKPRP